MNESILQSIKKLLGIDPEYTAFDAEILMSINSIFPILSQLGVGPVNGYAITGPEQKWVDYLGSNLNLSMVQTYMGMRVRMLFDPPSTQHAIAATEKQIEMFEWRISMQREAERLAPPLNPVPEEV